MTNTIKFVAVTEQVQDAVIWVDDVEVAIQEEGIEKTLEDIMNRVIDGDLDVPGAIHVVDDNKELATNIANVLEDAYNKEMELMNEANIAKEQVNKVVDQVMPVVEEEVDATAAIAKSAAAKKFLEKHGANMVNGKKAPAQEEKANNTKEDTKEEVKMNNNTMGSRRRLNTSNAGVQKEETKSNQTTNREEESTMKRQGTGRRVSSNEVKVNESTRRKVTGRKMLSRSASIKGNTFQKFEGPWYLNASMYPVLDRFEEILETMSDAELGIEQIVLVDPQDIRRYERRNDILVVIQIKSNGTVLEFPIKENNSSNSSSDLSSTSIGWTQTKNGMRPAFGFWRSNAPVLDMKCACGNKMENVSGSNVYCSKCRTRHDDVEVNASHNLEITNFNEVVFQEIPNLFVPRETLALVMAIAQYDAGFDMWDVIVEEEDAQ